MFESVQDQILLSLVCLVNVHSADHTACLLQCTFCTLCSQEKYTRCMKCFIRWDISGQRPAGSLLLQIMWANWSGLELPAVLCNHAVHCSTLYSTLYCRGAVQYSVLQWFIAGQCTTVLQLRLVNYSAVVQFSKGFSGVFFLTI